jgi:uncharacterized protein (DUF58 family)
MAYRSLAWSKFDYARWCAAALGHLIISQRDTAGLVLFDSEHRAKVPPGNGAAQRAAIFDTLEKATPSGTTRIGDVLSWITPKLKSRGIVCVFSDFFDDTAKIVGGLRALIHAGHEPILFQILDPAELRFEFQGLLKLEGLESLGVQKVDPRAIRAAYLEEMEKHNKELARQASAMSVDLVSIDTQHGLDAVLSTYLSRRTARARGGRR